MKLKHLLLLLMTVVSFSTTRAADDTTVVPTNWTKVAFNSDFRYSQWVINSRLGDFYGNSTQVGFTQYDGNGNIVGSAKTSKFDYVPGLVAKATLEARDLYKDFDWSKPWFYTVLNYGKAYTYTAKSASEQNSKGLKGLTLDNMNAAKMYFGIAADALATSSDKTFSEEQIAGIIIDMKLYNENWAIGGANSTNELGDAVAGGWFHKPEYVDQMWGDGLYMGSALLAQIINNKGTSANVTDNDWDLITKQFRISWKYMYNETNGLLWHAFTANRTTAMNAGWEGITADGSTYHSAAHWGRACGWYFLALVDVLEQMQIQIKAGKLQETDANYNELKNYVKLLAAGLAEYQDASGCWYQIIDEKDSSLAGNYLESSCTAIFTAAYLKGARLDLFEDKKNDYIAVAEKAYEGFVNNFMMRDANGDAQLIHCCASAGLGGSKKRSGSRDYYITGDDVTQRNTYTEGKVLGGFILAATEYERLHKAKTPVLLTLDLQPEHTLDGKTALEVAVSGNGTATYQWYKDNAPISGATEVKYIPTETGKYYCLVTVTPTSSPAKGRATQNSDGTYTIKSQETNVTVTAETEGVIYDYTVKISEATNNIKYNATGGTATLGSGNKVDDKGFKSDGDLGTAKYICAELTGTLKAGDVIGIKAMATSSNGGIYIATSNTTTTDYVNAGTLSTKNAAETLTYTVKADDKLVGKSAFYLYRNGVSTYIQQITVTRKDGPTTYTVTYNANGHGTAPTAKTGVTSLTQEILNATPGTVDGWTFGGWYYDSACTNEPTEGESISANTTLYAKWIQNSSGTPSTATISWLDMALNSHNATTIAGIVTPEQFSSCLTGKIGIKSGLETNGTVSVNSTTYYKYKGFGSKEDTNIYFEYPYSVTGAKFTPTSLSVSWSPAGSGEVRFKAYGVKTDDTIIPLSGEIKHSNDKVYGTDKIDMSSVEEELKAIRIVPYSTNTDKSIVLNNVVLEGTVEINGLNFDKGTLTGRTLTVIHEPADAGTSCTIGIIPTDGVTCALGTLPAGVTASLSADGKTLTYNAPAAGTGFISIPLIATTADRNSYEYTVLVGTRVAPSYTSQYDNNKAWTPAVGGTIALSKLINYEGDDVHVVTISSGDAATLSADGKTLTAVKTGEISLSLPATDNYSAASMKIQVNIGTDVAKDGTNAYTIESDKVYSDGLAVNRENITMTFGNDGFWAKGTTFSAGQKNPTPNSGKIPTSGTYYKFTPAKNGTLTATVYIGKTDDGKLRPLYVSENGTAIEAKAGELTVGKGETPVAPAVGYYQGEVTFNVKANTDYYVYVNGSKMRFYGFKFVSVASSDNTATFSRGVLNGETLTVTHPKSEANSPQTITVTPAIGATCTSVSGPATLDGDVIRYTAPVAGASLADITLTVTAENGDAKTYTINVSTVGDVTIGNAIFSVSELDKFGVFTGQKREIEKQSVTLTAVDGSEGNVQGQENGSGAKVQKTAGFTITPNPGYLITKVTLVTSQNNRHFDATPAQAGDIVQDDKTYEYSFNRIGDPITFSNNSGNGIYVTRIIVEYEKSVGTGKTILAASFDKNELTFYEDDTEIPALPVLSVKIGDEVADAGLYTVTYTSSNLNVVTVDTNGKLTKVGAGSAVINAEITPNDGNTYAGSEAYYTVTVTSLEEPVVTAHDLTVYNTAGVQPQPVIEVFATDNGTPVRISNYYYTLQFTEIEDNDDIINNDADGNFILNGERGDWKVGTATMKVTVSPTEEAKQRFHIKGTVAEFKVTVVETGDMLLPYFGGVENGKMQKSALVNARTFITPVLYGGVDISEGFTFDCSFVDAVGSTTVATPAARLKSGTKKVTSFTGSKEANVTIYSGNSAETVYIHVVAKPNNDYKTQYKQIEKWISVDIGEYKRFLDVSIEPTKQTVPVGTVLDQLNDFTVTVRDEDGKTLSYEDGEYTMVWQSSSPGVASVDRGEVAMYATGRKVRALSGGVADIKVIVSKGGYSDMGAVCTLTVTDEGMFKVNGNTTYSKGTQFTVDGLTLSLGGWMFSSMSDLTESPWQKYGTTSEKPGKDTAWGSPTTANKKPLGFTHNIQMTNMKNARQEYGSNCMPESRNIYNPKLVEQKFVLMDPMFNVPCAGAYFALSPMTCGTVTVYVRQNGIFEHSSGDYAYRPQRRVFVMDEQGHLVSSTPKLEYPTNWDMGNDGTVFTCDILDKTVKEKSLYELAEANPTKVNGVVPEAEKQKVRNYVQNRLIGLKNFSIQNFKNGVYASNIVDTTFHNAAYEKYKDTPDELAARGWSVLSVAPVSYTFYVKPGKTYYIYNFGSKLGLYGFTFRKDNVTEDEFNWTDTKDVTPEPTAERHVAKVNIDRTFKAGVWAACVLPFSMTRQQVNAVFGDCFDNQAGHENGTQILYFDRVEGHKIYFRRHAYNTLVAGKPFLIKPAKEAVISSANMGDYPYVTIEAPTPQAEWGRTAGNTVGIGSIDTDYTWVSSYGSMTALPGDYYLNGNGDVSHCTEGYQIPIKGFRGYLKAKTKQAASKVLQLAYDSNVDGDGEATPIEGLVMDSEGNFLEVPTSGVVYNLSGQVVTRDADKLYTLPAGIYIVNGKKYIVR